MPGMTVNKRFAHAWNVSRQEAIAIQHELRSHIVIENRFRAINSVAGVDVSFPEQHTARAAVVVLCFPELKPIDCATAQVRVTFPYIPGLLAFREAPAVLAAVEELRTLPDLFIFDAHGLAHPRRLGLACHAGLLLDRPSIGCAKSRLVGEYVEPEPERGEHAALMDGEEQLGTVVRTRARVKPVFVSVGHRVDLGTAVNLVLDCTPRYRLPETTRCAHRLAGGQKIELEKTDQRSTDEGPLSRQPQNWAVQSAERTR